MAYVPKTIKSENYSNKGNFSAVLPEIKKLHKFNSIKIPPPSINCRDFHLRQSSVINRPKNPIFNLLEYNRKCKNLWTNFDNRISPILRKYKFISSPKKKAGMAEESFDRDSKCADKNKQEKKKKGCYYDSGDPTDFGIQCEISSENSENEDKIKVSRYVHYINIGDCFSN